MKCLPEQSSPSEAVATPSSSRSLRFVLEIFTVDCFDPDSSGVSERAAGHGDETCNSLDTAHPIRCYDQAAEIQMLVASDSDDEDLQWANAKPVFRPASACGRGRCSYRARNIPVKEKERFPHKPLPSPRSVVHHQRPGLIRPHSVPFSGSLTHLKKNSFRGKPKKVPTIIPMNLPRRKVGGFHGSDPMSPNVTCLGRIKSKKLDNIYTPKAICAGLRMGQKIRCFDTKNQLCGKNCKGRKKSRRRFTSAEAKSVPVEVAQTRREKAANLARSLTEMLEGLRQSEDRSSYEPIVPPPNSLLLMRGLQKGNKEVDMDSNMDEQPINENADISQHCKPMEPPPNCLLLMRGGRARGQDIDIVNKFSNKKTAQHPQFRTTLNQRRSFAELSSIEVSWRTKMDT